MADAAPGLKKITLDKKLDKIGHVEAAVTTVARGLAGPSLGLLFLILAAVFAAVYVAGEPRAFIIVPAAAGIGAYMALNIGANDVANNVGPAVGSKALMLGGALIIAAVFESAGALIAGGDVVSTISRSIIEPTAVASPETFIRVMTAALMSSALWVNLATWIGAPVSTTHSVVGGAMGAGRAAARHDRRQLDNDGRNCRQLGDFTIIGRRHRGCFPGVHQELHHLSGRQDRRRAALDAGSDRDHGGRVRRISGDERLEEGHQARWSDNPSHWRCRRNCFLGHHTPAYQEAVPGS